MFLPCYIQPCAIEWFVNLYRAIISAIKSIKPFAHYRMKRIAYICETIIRKQIHHIAAINQIGTKPLSQPIGPLKTNCKSKCNNCDLHTWLGKTIWPVSQSANESQIFISKLRCIHWLNIPVSRSTPVTSPYQTRVASACCLAGNKWSDSPTWCAPCQSSLQPTAENIIIKPPFSLYWWHIWPQTNDNRNEYFH